MRRETDARMNGFGNITMHKRMKNILLLLGFSAIVLGMASCRKVCECTTYQNGKSINNYLREKSDKSQPCSELQDVGSADSTIYMRCL